MLIYTGKKIICTDILKLMNPGLRTLVNTSKLNIFLGVIFLDSTKRKITLIKSLVDRSFKTCNNRTPFIMT